MKADTTKTKGIKLFRGPLQMKLLSIILFSILAICAVMSIVSSYIFKNYLKTHMINTSAISLSNLSESINSNVDNVYRMVRYCQGSSDIAEYISAAPSPGSVLSNRIHDRFTEEYQGNEANSYIGRVVVIAGDNYLQVCQTNYSTIKNLATEVPNLDYFKDLLDSTTYNYSTGVIEDPFLNGNPKYVIPIIRPIIYKYNSDMIGFVYLEFSSSLITDQIKKYHLEDDSNIYLIMEDHIYECNNFGLSELSNNIFSAKFNSEYKTNSNITVREVEYNGDKGTILIAPLKMDNCYIVQRLSETTLRSSRSSFMLLFTAILLSIIAVGVLLSIAMDRMIYKPMLLIRKKISETAAGDFSREPAIEWEHELGDIGKGINDLSESINELLETRLRDEKDKRDLEYKMLQSQINPHFLYNSLNSIKMMAQIQGATGIVDMTTALSSLLRSISKGTSLVIPISEELNLARDYFTIQNYRYGGMIGFNVIVDSPEIVKSKIVKFTLQPLVENAIFHGLEPKGCMGNIALHLYYNDEKTICIDVTDDGVGIAPEKAADLLTKPSEEKNDFFKEIGISNVNRRIQLEFGSEYGISIESVPGEFTTMRVLLPKDDENV